MISRRKKTFKGIVTVAAVAAIFWLLDRIGWHVIGDYAVRLGWKGVLALVALGMTESLLDSLSLGFAIREKIGYFRLFCFHQAGSLVNTFVPWEAGEVLKSRLLYNHVSSKSAISGTVIWNYAFKLSKPAAALTAACTGWALARPGHETTSLAVVGAAGIAFVPYAGWRLILYLGPASLIIRAAFKLRLVRKKDPRALLSSAQEIDATMRDFWKHHPAAYLKVLVFQYLARIVQWAALYCALAYLAPERGYGFAFCGMIFAGFNVLSYLVLVLPTRLGTEEGAGYLLFALLGLDPALGLVTQIALRLKATLTHVVPAGFVLFDKPSK